MSNNWNKFNPPPNADTGNTNVKDVSEIILLQAPAPSLPFLGGEPVVLIDQNTAPFPTTIDIIFSERPFTYLNMGSPEDIPLEPLTINLFTVPVGTIFIVNGPREWVGGVEGKIVLQDKGSDGLPLPDSELFIPARGTELAPTIYQSIIIARASKGLYGKAMN